MTTDNKHTFKTTHDKSVYKHCYGDAKQNYVSVIYTRLFNKLGQPLAFQKLITDSKMHELDKTIAIKLTRFASNKYSATAFLTLCYF